MKKKNYFSKYKTNSSGPSQRQARNARQRVTLPLDKISKRRLHNVHCVCKRFTLVTRIALFISKSRAARTVSRACFEVALQSKGGERERGTNIRSSRSFLLLSLKVRILRVFLFIFYFSLKFVAHLDLGFQRYQNKKFINFLGFLMP